MPLLPAKTTQEPLDNLMIADFGAFKVVFCAIEHRPDDDQPWYVGIRYDSLIPEDNGKVVAIRDNNVTGKTSYLPVHVLPAVLQHLDIISGKSTI